MDQISGDSYVDINLMPQIAVEKIEILKEGKYLHC